MTLFNYIRGGHTKIYELDFMFYLIRYYGNKSLFDVTPYFLKQISFNYIKLDLN